MELKAEKITREFIRPGGKTNRFFAVKETDLTLASGKLTVLMGRSGSGKTTLLNMLSGLLMPSTGKITADGRDLYAMPDKELSKFRNVHMGVIPQGQTAIHSLNVTENILLPFGLYGDKPDEARAKELMERLDIAELASARPAELSGGELRRVAIARALVRRPEVIFADEPTGDLDDENTAAVFTFLKECAREGAAVLVVTHENEAVNYADEVLRMNAGTLEQG
ncbi:ABC transporter ATP-binding protein [Ruminococcus sp.]|uniref:ABC transporter ATP-binding protein n=1 Tax=Ruminococcus sp. TaxID=41978 RepID=UPI0025F45833|nr:ABC transporter ATP-binding protein [Ruminococcus sp.]MBQ8966092.1 ABC transporter ATP-binding protein [Ruminococcus sp.]